MAIKWAVKKFRCYLYGVEFEVYTDHKPIVHVKTSRNPSDRMLKWILELEEYNIKYFYRPGKYNVPADVLSRLNEKDDEPIDWYTRRKSLIKLKSEQNRTVKDTSKMLESSDDEFDSVLAIGELQTDIIGKSLLTAAQKTDEHIKAILSNFNKGFHKSNFRVDKDGTLYLIHQRSGQWRLVIPKCYKNYVLKACHDDLGGVSLVFDSP